MSCFVRKQKNAAVIGLRHEHQHSGDNRSRKITGQDREMYRAARQFTGSGTGGIKVSELGPVDQSVSGRFVGFLLNPGRLLYILSPHIPHLT